MLSYDFLSGVPLYILGALVPAENESIFVNHENSVVTDALDQQTVTFLINVNGFGKMHTRSIDEP